MLAIPEYVLPDDLRVLDTLFFCERAAGSSSSAEQDGEFPTGMASFSRTVCRALGGQDGSVRRQQLDQLMGSSMHTLVRR